MTLEIEVLEENFVPGLSASVMRCRNSWVVRISLACFLNLESSLISVSLSGFQKPSMEPSRIVGRESLLEENR